MLYFVCYSSKICILNLNYFIYKPMSKNDKKTQPGWGTHSRILRDQDCSPF